MSNLATAADPNSAPAENLVIVIATYNEADNLPLLVSQLFDHLPAATILVIDDNSPDGTGKWCDENVSRFPKLNCIHRSGKLGLGSATIEGFAWAIKHQFSYVATMDADFSHDPASLPILFDTIAIEPPPNLAVAIGSRYVTGGAIEGWPLYRRVASILVNAFARRWLRLPSHDNSGAFRVYKTAALQSIGLDSIQSDSYSYLEEVLLRLHQAGYHFQEQPITFRDREHGASKTSLRLGLTVFWEIFQMRNSGQPRNDHVSASGADAD